MTPPYMPSPYAVPQSPQEDTAQLLSLLQMLQGQDGQQSQTPPGSPMQLDSEDPSLSDTGIPQSNSTSLLMTMLHGMGM